MTRKSKNQEVLYYAPYVKAGVEFLNDKVPGWYKPHKLAISDLDLSSPHQCVLGQLAAKSAITGAGFFLGGGYADYSEACEALDVVGGQIGCDTLEHGQEDEEADYAALNHLWAHAIRLTRRGEKVTLRALRSLA